MACPQEKKSPGRHVQFARLLLLAVLLPVFLVAHGEVGLPNEFQIKAVFLYNFAQFVDWPPDAFESSDSPLIIGVLGMDPFGDFLEATVRGETVNGRRLVVERYRWVSEVDECHVLFVSGSEGSQAGHIAAMLEGRAILTVSDWESAGRGWPMIRFVMQRNRIRLRINLDAARSAGLTISSKLLRSAEMVTASRTQP